MSSMLLERLARVAYETMVGDTERWFGVFPNVTKESHSWDVQSQAVKHSWMRVAQAIQQELKTPEWPAVGEEYILRMRNPQTAVGVVVTKMERNDQGCWIVQFREFGGNAKMVNVLWTFQEDARDYREWNVLGGDKS